MTNIPGGGGLNMARDLEDKAIVQIARLLSKIFFRHYDI